MPKVFGSSNLIEITTLKHLMERAGLSPEIRNEHTGTMLPLGELTEIELWVTDASQLAAAESVAAEYQRASQREGEGPAWFCEHCKEANPDTFALCWQCGAERE